MNNSYIKSDSYSDEVQYRFSKLYRDAAYYWDEESKKMYKNIFWKGKTLIAYDYDNFVINLFDKFVRTTENMNHAFIKNELKLLKEAVDILLEEVKK